MPEVVNVICHYKDDEEMDEDLKRGRFEEIPHEEMDPTIRRVCERAGLTKDDEVIDQMELVKALRAGKDHIDGETVFGVYTDRHGHKEYVGLNRRDRCLVIVHRDWVEKRRLRYTVDPFPESDEDRMRFVDLLIYEIVEKWSGDSYDTMGASYAQIVSHVADYSNIERPLAEEWVNRLLPSMTILERSVGDHWRIKPPLFRALQRQSPGELPS